MSLAPQNVSMTAGDSVTLVVTVTRADGSIVDLTGAQSLRWVLAAAPTQPTLASKSIGFGIAVTNPPAGVMQVSILPADTDGLAGSYYHEAQLIDLNGNVSTILQGTVAISPHLLR
jgi:hypothetical protein